VHPCESSPSAYMLCNSSSLVPQHSSFLCIPLFSAFFFSPHSSLFLFSPHSSFLRIPLFSAVIPKVPALREIFTPHGSHWLSRRSVGGFAYPHDVICPSAPNGIAGVLRMALRLLLSHSEPDDDGVRCSCGQLIRAGPHSRQPAHDEGRCWSVRCSCCR